MRKMLLIMVAGLITSLASAGNLNWACGGFTENEGDIAYLFMCGETGPDKAAITAAIQGNSFDTSAAVASANIEEGEVYKSKVGSYTSTTVYGYMVVFDEATVEAAKNFKISDVVSAKFGQSGNKNFDFSASIGSATWTAVPEPCSVALVLLGVAALGLKRKIA